MSEVKPETGAFDVVALAASAGGYCQILNILAALPQDFPAAILIVHHLSPHYPTEMATLLTRNSGRNVKLASEGDHVGAGSTFLAPPKRHLIVNSNRLSLSNSDKVCYTRPVADPLFSVAASYGPRAIAIVLSGAGHDGAAGIRAIKSRGGTTIAVDPSMCDQPRMSELAIATGCVDFVLAPEKIARALVALVMLSGRMMLPISRCNPVP